jgi:hypothetical protein
LPKQKERLAWSLTLPSQGTAVPMAPTVASPSISSAADCTENWVKERLMRLSIHIEVAACVRIG